MFLKWKAGSKASFQGACFGMTNTAAQIFDNVNWYLAGAPQSSAYSNLNCFSYPNNNNTLAGILQMQCKAVYPTEDISYEAVHQSDLLKVTMQTIKQELRNSRGRPHRVLGIVFQSSAGGHAVFPYMLVPGKGGNGIDTVYIYDPNLPGRNDRFIVVDQKQGNGGIWDYPIGYGDYGGVSNGQGLFMENWDSVFFQPWHFGLRPGGGPVVARGGNVIEAFFNDSSVVHMADDNDSVAVFTTDSSISTPLIMPHNRFSGMDSIEPISAFSTSALATVSKVSLPGYDDNFLSIAEPGYFLTCNRTGGNATTDNYTFSSGNITYINKDTGSLPISFTVDMEDSTSEYNYYITGLSVPAGNKIAVTTSGINGMVLQNFGPATSYTVTTDFVTPDSIITFTGVIPIQANTQHTILPHDTTYSGIYILVDTGMTGHIEDSIFITPTTVTGIKTANTAGIKAWPIPSFNELYVSGPQGLVSYKIVDITGRIVTTGEVDFGNGTTQKFDVHSFAPGVYTITGTGLQGKWTYMFVKQ